jgi:large subunit ribosomal protein L54
MLRLLRPHRVRLTIAQNRAYAAAKAKDVAEKAAQEGLPVPVKPETSQSLPDTGEPRTSARLAFADTDTDTTIPTIPRTLTLAAQLMRRSSCSEQTVIDGVNIFKGQPPVVALPDDQYPEWLWGILEPLELPDDGPGGKKERRQMRLENRQKIKDQNFMKTQ